MQFEKEIVGIHRSNIEFDIANLSDDTLEEIAGGIISFSFSPIAALDSKTKATLIITKDIAKLCFICTDGVKALVAQVSIDKFGCAKENYLGPISEMVQFYMQEKYGQEYYLALNEKLHGYIQ